MNQNEIHISLKIFDFSCEPSELSNRLGIESTKQGIKGEPLSSKNGVARIWPYNFWEYGIKKETNEFIETPINNYIKNIIQPRETELIDIISNCKSEFSVAQYYYTGHNPGLHLEPETIKIISKIGAGIDVDIYCLAEDE